MSGPIAEITGSIDVKRFYLPGFALIQSCPECGAVVSWDGHQQYISHPEIDKPEHIDMYCECGREWRQAIRIRVTVELEGT